MGARLRVRRSPHGERGLKYLQLEFLWLVKSRSPHGERGLKCIGVTPQSNVMSVAPLTGSVD